MLLSAADLVPAVRAVQLPGAARGQAVLPAVGSVVLDCPGAPVAGPVVTLPGPPPSLLLPTSNIAGRS